MQSGCFAGQSPTGARCARGVDMQKERFVFETASEEALVQGSGPCEFGRGFWERGRGDMMSSARPSLA